MPPVNPKEAIVEVIKSVRNKRQVPADKQPSPPPLAARYPRFGARLMAAALTVFDINMAMVSGPTPPGTGV